MQSNNGRGTPRIRGGYGTSNGSSNQTVGHGLGQDIDMVIVKNRAANNTDNWRAWHSGLTGNSYFLGLNQNATQSDSSTVFNGHSSSTFTIGNDSAVNNNVGENNK